MLAFDLRGQALRVGGLSRIKRQQLVQIAGGGVPLFGGDGGLGLCIELRQGAQARRTITLRLRLQIARRQLQNGFEITDGAVVVARAEQCNAAIVQHGHLLLFAVEPTVPYAAGNEERDQQNHDRRGQRDQQPAPPRGLRRAVGFGGRSGIGDAAGGGARFHGLQLQEPTYFVQQLVEALARRLHFFEARKMLQRQSPFATLIVFHALGMQLLKVCR